MRIASLLPSATEILFAIGAGEEVVGVTHECDFPSDTHRLPRLTSSAIDHNGQTCAAIDRHIKGALHRGSSIYKLDEALLAELKPDLIVTQELCDVCAVAYGEVERAARRLPGEVDVLSLEPSSMDDIVATLLAVGRATGHESGARAKADEMLDRIAAVDRQDRPADPPTVACIEWTDPIMAGGHWVPEMVRRAGGNDVLGPEGLPSIYLDWSQVVESRPDLMLLMPCGFGLEETLGRSDDIRGREGFADLPCARAGRVVALDGSSYFNRPGPRIVHGLEIVAAAVRAKPGDPLPAGAAWVH